MTTGLKASGKSLAALEWSAGGGKWVARFPGSNHETIWGSHPRCFGEWGTSLPHPGGINWRNPWAYAL